MLGPEAVGTAAESVAATESAERECKADRIEGRPDAAVPIRGLDRDQFKTLGLSVVENDGSGDCLFHALAQHLASVGKTPTDGKLVRAEVVACGLSVHAVDQRLTLAQDG